MFLVAAVLTSSCASPEFRFERVDGGAVVPMKLTALQGFRDGATVNVEALFSEGADSGKMDVVLRLTPAAECASARHRVTVGGQTVEGTVQCSSLNFLGGQNSQPSVGGVFILNDSQNRPTYRVRIPTTLMTRRPGGAG
jgi:hypothetical protein